MVAAGYATRVPCDAIGKEFDDPRICNIAQLLRDPDTQPSLDCTAAADLARKPKLSGKTPGSGLAAEGSRYISYRHDNGSWLNAGEDHVLALAMPGPCAGLDVEMTPCMALEDAWS